MQNLFPTDLPKLSANGKETFMRPNDGGLAAMAAGFKDAPVQNLDGTSGISVHYTTPKDFGIPMATKVNVADIVKGGYINQAEEEAYFQVAWYDNVGEFCNDPGASACAQIGSNQFFVMGLAGWDGANPGDYAWHWPRTEAISHFTATILMHELGHNLGLTHPAFTPWNVSVMNYAYTRPGIVYSTVDNGQEKYHTYLSYASGPIYGIDPANLVDDTELRQGVDFKANLPNILLRGSYCQPDGKVTDVLPGFGTLNKPQWSKPPGCADSKHVEDKDPWQCPTKANITVPGALACSFSPELNIFSAKRKIDPAENIIDEWSSLKIWPRSQGLSSLPLPASKVEF